MKFSFTKNPESEFLFYKESKSNIKKNSGRRGRGGGGGVGVWLG